MIVEKQKIDRERIDREMETRRCVERLLAQVVEALGPGERLGRPRRERDCIVIPIVTNDGSPSVETEPLRMLVAAWLDEPGL